MKFILNERGISLVEVVASLVIITIIFLAFFNFFIQSKKTNVASEGIHDATYIAQVEMEKMYTLASTPNSVSQLNLPPFIKVDPPGTCSSINTYNPNTYSTSYSKTENKDIYSIETTIYMLCDYSNAGKVIIRVLDKHLERAKMENVYIWK